MKRTQTKEAGRPIYQRGPREIHLHVASSVTRLTGQSGHPLISLLRVKSSSRQKNCKVLKMKMKKKRQSLKEPDKFDKKFNLPMKSKISAYLRSSKRKMKNKRAELYIFT